MMVTAATPVGATPDQTGNIAKSAHSLGVGNAKTILIDAAVSAGKISYTSEIEGLYESKVFVMGADGSGPTKMTGPIVIDNTSARDYAPSCSPDGTKIAFYSSRGGNNDIYTVDLTGNITQLTTDSHDDSGPAWSPDGRKIVFVSNRDGNMEIYVMNMDGSGQTRLTNNSANDISPRWLPDGSLAFDSDRDGTFKTYLMNADGSNLKLFSGPHAVWSPDGSKIAYSTAISASISQIYVANSDGSNPTELTDSQSNNLDPAWSPDSSEIAFSSNRDSTPAIYGNRGYDIFTMNADGSNQTNITHNGSTNLSPSWTTGNWISQTVTTLDATYLSFNSTQLRGQLTSLGSLSSVTVSFVYLVTPGNYTGETPPQVMTSTGIFTFDFPFSSNDMSYRAKVTGIGVSFGDAKTIPLAPPNNSITLGSLYQTYDGQPKTVTYTTSPSGLIASLTYSGSNTAPSDAGNYPIVATIISSGYSGSATGTLVVAKAAPVFSNLTTASLSLGTTPTTLGGILQAGSLVPSGNVIITLNGTTQTVSINSSTGSFISSFNTSALTVSGSPFPISYSYNGDSNFNSISDNSHTVTITTLTPTPTPTPGTGNTTGTVASTPIGTGATNEYSLNLSVTSTTASGLTVGQQVWCAASTTDFPNLLTLGATLAGTLDNSLGWWVLKSGTDISPTPPPPPATGNTIGTVARMPTSSGAANEYDLYLNITSTTVPGLIAGQQVWCAANTKDFPNLLTVGATLTGTLDNSLGWWVLNSGTVVVPPPIPPTPPPATGNTIGTVGKTPFPSGGANEYNLYLTITSTTVSGLTVGQQVWCAANTKDFPNLLTVGATLTGTLDNSLGWWVLKK
jgi:hypothetical protein